MSTGVTDLATLVASMRPSLHEGTFAYARLPADADVTLLQPIGTFREAEGLTVIVPEAIAVAAGVEILFRCAWITLTVHSALSAVGLTAAFATALAEAGLSCNVMAGACHDHLFVPVEDGPRALAVLEALQRCAAGAPSGAT